MQDPHVYVRLSACCLALGIPSFTLPQLKWAAYQTRNVDAPDFWQPYEVFREAPMMRPWAISHLNFLNGESLGNKRLSAIDPLSFYRDLDARLRERGDATLEQLELARQAMTMTIPELAREQGFGQLADDLDMMYAKVEVARFQGRLVTDTTKIRRLKAA